jgi:uncharacterized membrane protein
MTADRPRREHRWPPAVALAVLVLLPIVVPDHLTYGPGWVVPIIGSLFLVALVAVDPERDSRRERVSRQLTIALTVLLILVATYMTLVLLKDLMSSQPNQTTENGEILLTSGAIVWVYNNVLFALLYWELDGGGPATRARRGTAVPDLAFPQQLNPPVAPAGWRPLFSDYLYLGLTNALAFSPTDVMPLARWAKATMALQSLISFVVVGLVIANAVNVLKN